MGFQGTPIGTLGVGFDNGGSVLAQGQVGHVRTPTSFTITGWEMYAQQSGSVTIAVARASYADLPTFTSIDGTEVPALSTAQKNRDLALTTWTTGLAAGDWVQFQVADADATGILQLWIFLIGIKG